jgi:hypothetical protein
MASHCCWVVPALLSGQFCGFFWYLQGLFVGDWCGIFPISALAGYGWAVFRYGGAVLKLIGGFAWRSLFA